MAGIVGYGAFIPRNRITTEEIENPFLIEAVDLRVVQEIEKAQEERRG